MKTRASNEMSVPEALFTKAKDTITSSIDHLLSDGDESASTLARLRTLWRRALNLGPSLLLLSALFVAASGYASRVLIIRFLSYQTQIEATLAGHYQSSRDKTYYGVLGALLGPLTTANVAGSCGLSDPTADASLSPHSRTSCLRVAAANQALAALWSGVGGDELQVIAAVNDARSLLAAQYPGYPHWNDWLSKAEKDVRAVRERLRPQIGPMQAAVVPCTPSLGGTTASRAHQSDFGPLGCEQASRTTTLVVSARTNICPDASSSFCVQPRVEHAIAASLLVDDTLQPAAYAQAHEPPFSEFDDIRFVQAYFISPDDVLRIWRAHGTVAAPGETYPGSTRWANAPYFEQLLATDTNTVVSSPYIDFGGNGVIRTLCQSLSVPPGPHGHLIGAFCADFTIPLADLARFTGSDLLDVRYVDIRLTGSLPLSPTSISVAHTLAELRDRVTGPPEERQALSKELLQAALDLTPGPTQLEARALARTVSHLPAENAFIVPIGHLGEGGEDFRALLVAPQGQLARLLSAPAFALLASLSCLLMCVYYGTRRGLRLAELDVQTRIVNSLHIGILFLSDGTSIQAGNARAEEILGLNFSPLGISEATPGARRRLGELFEDKLIRVDPSGSYGIEPFSALHRQRLPGSSQDYYAKLCGGERKGEWVRVSDCPASMYATATGDPHIIEEIVLVEQVSDPRLWHLLEAHFHLFTQPGAWLVLDTQGKIKVANDLAKAMLGLKVPRAGDPLDHSPRLGLRDVLEPWVVLRSSRDDVGDVDVDDRESYTTEQCTFIAKPLEREQGQECRFGRLKTGIRKRHWIGLRSLALAKTKSSATDHTVVEVLAVEDKRLRNYFDRLALVAGVEPIVLLSRGDQDHIEAANAEAGALLGARLLRPAIESTRPRISFGSLIEPTIILKPGLKRTEYRPRQEGSFFARTTGQNAWIRVWLVERDSRSLYYFERAEGDLQQRLDKAPESPQPAMTR